MGWAIYCNPSQKTVSHNPGRERGCLCIYVLFLRHHWKLTFFVFQSFSPTHESHMNTKITFYLHISNVSTLFLEMGTERLCVNRTALAQNIKTEEMLPAQRSKHKLRQNPVCGTSYIILLLARSWFSPGGSTVTEGQVCLFVCVSELLKVCHEEVNQARVQMSEKDEPYNKPTGWGKLISCCLK